MQKLLKLLTVAAVPCLLLAANASASLSTTLDKAPSGYRDPNSYGGEFTSILSGDPTLSSSILNHYSSEAKATVNGQTGFETFCVEIDESFTPGDTYNASISP